MSQSTKHLIENSVHVPRRIYIFDFDQTLLSIHLTSYVNNFGSEEIYKELEAWDIEDYKKILSPALLDPEFRGWLMRQEAYIASFAERRLIEIVLQKLKIRNLFHGIFSSKFFHFKNNGKNAAIHHIWQKNPSKQQEDFVLIDDCSTNIDAAKREGFQTIKVDDSIGLRTDDIRNFLQKNKKHL